MKGYSAFCWGICLVCCRILSGKISKQLLNVEVSFRVGSYSDLLRARLQATSSYSSHILSGQMKITEFTLTYL